MSRFICFAALALLSLAFVAEEVKAGPLMNWLRSRQRLARHAPAGGCSFCR